MFLKRTLGSALIGAAFLAGASAVQAAEQWYFYVANKSDSRMVRLEVSENKKTWGQFDIGAGIDRGETVKLIWDASTNDQDCNQWIRAKFADGSTSQPTRMDFCEDLDVPIEFE